MKLNKFVEQGFNYWFGCEVINVLQYENGFLYPDTDTINPEFIESWLMFLLMFTKDDYEIDIGAIVEINNGRTGIRVLNENLFIAHIYLDFYDMTYIGYQHLPKLNFDLSCLN